MARPCETWIKMSRAVKGWTDVSCLSVLNGLQNPLWFWSNKTGVFPLLSSLAPDFNSCEFCRYLHQSHLSPSAASRSSSLAGMCNSARLNLPLLEDPWDVSAGETLCHINKQALDLHATDPKTLLHFSAWHVLERDSFVLERSSHQT